MTRSQAVKQLQVSLPLFRYTLSFLLMWVIFLILVQLAD
uniref:Uncharacterized protein n=1 Tax=Rhizophora mucronata TaxID=61149 RepID=A0A2P2LPS1_RHIMU